MAAEGFLRIGRRGHTSQVRYASDDPYEPDRQSYTRFLCIFGQSTHACKTRGEERRYCLPEVKPMRTTRHPLHGTMRSVHLRSRA